MVGDREKCLEAGAEGLYRETLSTRESFAEEVERFIRPRHQESPQ